MANQIRIKRRASTGAAGAPSSLKNAELAFNEADNTLYYGYGDDGNGNATSVVGIAGSGNNVTLAGTQTVTGNKTFSGTVDLTGPFNIDGVEVTSTAAELNILDGATLSTAELNYVDGVTSGIQGQIDGATSDISDLRTLSGTLDGAVNLGTFSGTTIADSSTVKAALQALETHAETNDSTVTEIDANVDDLITLSGVAENSTDLGDFTGVTIASGSTVKASLQALETSLETKAASTTVTEIDGNVDDLITLSGVAENSQHLGTFTGTTIGDNLTVKAALQALETELEDGSGSLTADDAGTADFASGTVTVAGGTGLSTTAALGTLTVNLDNTTVSANTYGSASAVGTFTVDAQGRLTGASTTSIDIAHTQVNDFDAGVQTNRLDQMAAPTANVAMNSQRLTGLADPVGDQDAATKAYVDASATGLDVKESVRAATTGNITLSGTQTVDGVALLAGDRVLVKDQSTGSENGIYDVVSGGSWTRSADADNSPSGGEVNSGMFVFVEEGTANADAGFVLTTDNPITLDTTALSFAQFSGAGQISAGAGMTKTGNTLDVGGNAGRIVVNANDVDLATHGTAGTYIGFTVDAYGRVSSFSSPTTLAGYGITDAQPLDATLTALAGLSTSGNQLIYATGSDTFALSTLSAYGRSLIDDADAATARTTLGLGTIATQDANNVTITGGSIDGCTIDGGTF